MRGDWDHVIIHDDTRVSRRSEHICFLSLSFQWDKQPRFIWKPLSFHSEPLKVMLQFEPADFFYSARVDSVPVERKHSRSATLRNWGVSCRSEWLTDCTQLLHYVLMLCPYAPVFALADKQSRGIHYSPPLCLGVDPLQPHTSPQMSGYIASPCSSQLPLGAPSAGPHVTVSRPLAGHPGWDTEPINASLGATRPPAG